MKRMHASILAPVVLLLRESQNIPVNSEQGKKITAVFEAVKKKKPIPYAFTTYVNGNFYGNILSVNRNSVTTIELGHHEGDVMTFNYSIRDQIIDGAYDFQTY